MSGRGLRAVALAGVVVAAFILAGCGEEDAARPPPLELAGGEVGHYCGMLVREHSGPKGQIFREGAAQPIWFSSVRDTIAFTMLPEEAKDVAAIYVNDMTRANWDSPEPGSWIEARDAWFVIESRRTGGMGAPEAVPFSDRAAAEALVASSGGRVVAFDDIPQAFILGGGEGVHAAGSDGMGHDAKAHAHPMAPGEGGGT